MRLRNRFVFILFILSNFIFGQLVEYKLEYKECIDCPDNLGKRFKNSGSEFILPTYETIYDYSSIATTYPSWFISGDYGRREGNYNNWHRGADFGHAVGGRNPEMGNAILAFESGTVVGIDVFDGNSYKILKIQSGDHVWGYGHIFYDGVPREDTYTPLPVSGIVYGGMPCGNFVLKKMDNSPKYAIVYYNPNGMALHALSEDLGTVTVAGETIQTTNSVTAGMPIAPIGNSGGNHFDHVHLYLYKDASNISQARADCKDPFQVLTYDYDVSIELYKNNLVNGNHISYIKATSDMHNNKVMNLDYLDLKIKREGEDNFEFIQGKKYLTKIHLGARKSTNIYPEPEPPTSPRNRAVEGLPIACDHLSGYGSTSRTGIVGNAYKDGGKIDTYYFGSENIDFRIHKQDVNKLANNNTFARYPDGKYTLQLTATNVKGEPISTESGDLSDEQDIIINNFYNFVKEVSVYSEPNYNYAVYRGIWTCEENSNTYSFSKSRDNPVYKGDDIYIKVLTNEPCTSLTLNIPEINYELISEPEIATQEHYYIITSGDYPADLPGNADLNFMISGEDAYSNNSIDALSPDFLSIYINPMSNESGWSPAPQSGEYDTYHRLQLGCSPTNKSIESSDCLVANFSYTIDEHTVHFTNESTGATSSSWDFDLSSNGGAYIVDDNESSPSVQYNNTGERHVTLTVENDAGDSDEITKIIYFIDGGVVAGFTYETMGNTVMFTNTSTGSNDYKWDFGDGQTFEGSDPASPTHTYSSFGTKDVTLTAYDRTEHGTYKGRHDITETITVEEPNVGVTISGYVYDTDYSNRLEGATISAGGLYNAVSQSDGSYSLEVPYHWTGFLTAEKDGWSVYGGGSGTELEDVTSPQTVYFTLYEPDINITTENLGYSYYKFTVTGAPISSVYEWEITSSDNSFTHNESSNVIRFATFHLPPSSNSNSSIEYTIKVTTYSEQNTYTTKTTVNISNSATVYPNLVNDDNCKAYRVGSVLNFVDQTEPFSEMSRLTINFGDNISRSWDTQHCEGVSGCRAWDHQIYSGFCRTFSHQYNTAGAVSIGASVSNLAGVTNGSDPFEIAIVDCSSIASTLSNAIMLDPIFSSHVRFYAGKFNLTNFSVDCSLNDYYLGACEEIVLNPGVTIDPTASHYTVLAIDPCLSSTSSQSMNENSFPEYDFNKEPESDPYTEPEFSEIGISIDDSYYTNDVNIFPNPNAGKFSLKSANSIIRSVQVFSPLGVLIENFQNINNDQHKIDISSYAFGLYSIKVETDKEVKVLKTSYTLK